MNITKTTIAIAIAITATFSTIETAMANDSTSTSNIHLAAGDDFNFKVFMNKSAKRYVKKNNEEWVTFNKVISLYNESTGSFLNSSVETKTDFFEASNAIKSKLSKMNKKEAQVWLKKVKVTENIFKFLWANKLEEKPMESIYELPASMQVEATIGR